MTSYMQLLLLLQDMGHLGMFALQVLVLVPVLVIIIAKILQIGWVMVWRPYAMNKILEKQGIKGPPYTFLYGSLKQIKKIKKAANDMVLDVNCNDITPKAFPYYHIWSSIYGETTLHWNGSKPVITIPDAELAKQILSNKFGFYEKSKIKPSFMALIGNGLATVAGLDWVRHRRILNPAFSIDKLKSMVKRMADCTIDMMEEWKNKGIVAKDGCIKIEINAEFQKLTADIIAHTAFGSSYLHGKEAFKAQQELKKYCASSATEIFIPGTQYLPSPRNLTLWRLERKVKDPLKCMIEERLTGKSLNNECYGDDLLGVMIAAASVEKKDGSPKLEMDEIIEECKTFFFAGHETTSTLLTWTIFLLSLHKDWQERLRQEVLDEFGMSIPDANMLSKLKLVNMVLLEVLRLYSPVIWLAREALKDMKLGDLMIPKGTQLAIPVIKIHRMKEYWGDDANEFNPMRFRNGISQAAKHPNALLSFSIGPRVCIGQNFAMLEAKAVLTLLLQRFSLSLSPDYKHAPTDNLILQPQYGLPVIAKPL